MIVIEIAKRMECGEPSPLFVPGKLKKSGEGSPHSIGSADLIYAHDSAIPQRP
jgi:hypothetical protein